MSGFYLQTAQAVSPLTRAEAKSYVKLPSSVLEDDALIDALIAFVTDYAEGYVNRALRQQDWTLSLSEFPDSICLFKLRVLEPADITSIEHYVNGSLVAVDQSTYYLANRTLYDEILLVDGEAWPTDTDTREASVEVKFVSKAEFNVVDRMKPGMLRHLAYAYENRGDYEGSSSGLSNPGKASGAHVIYDPMRIPRV